MAILPAIDFPGPLRNAVAGEITIGEDKMADRPTTAVAGTAEAPHAGLEPDAIGPAQDTIIGMANAAPAVSVGLTLAALAAAAAYAVGPIIVLTAIPMLIIANAYRRLNLWQAQCGASFEWVGRSINPYLGFMTGWLMITGTLVGVVSGVVVLAPSVLAVFGSTSTSTWPDILISTAILLIMVVIAIIGIRITARIQVGMGLIEYVILIGFAITGLVLVLSHHHGTFPITKGWFTISGIGGKGSLAAGFLIAVFMYTGWDASVYVNEETTRRTINPGRAAVLAVLFLAIIFTISEVGLQGVVSPARLQANSSSALVYVAQAMGGGGWAKVMALALALSVIASTGVGIVALGRMIYGMARRRALPPLLAAIHPRFSTPAVATLIIGAILVAVTWVYLLSTSVANAFTQVIDVTGLLYAAFYVLTAFAAVTYFRRRIVSNAADLVLVGILPLVAAAFLVWLVVKSLLAAPAPQLWSVAGVVVVGIVLMLLARFVLQSPFFQVERESAPREG
jgi:amino acid transporter